jgi:hypothetical protein
MRKAVFAPIAIVAAIILAFGSLGVAKAATPQCPSGSTCDIDAKAIDSHEIDDSEWHFVITDVSGGNAPGTINVCWVSSGCEDIDLDKVTGNVAHYPTTLHLDDVVVSAHTSIDGEWDGQFNLSHGPGSDECEGEDCDEDEDECEGEDCDEDEDECPAGTTGTYPDCTPIEDECPPGTTGTPPNCVYIVNECPAGTAGTPPNCDPVEEDYCAAGQGHSQETVCKNTKKEREHDCGQLQDPNERRKTSTWEWATRHFGKNGKPRCTSREYQDGWRMGDGHRGWFNPQWK